MNTSGGDGSLHTAIVGAGGYVGGELLRLLDRHPAVATIAALSPSRAGQPVGATHPRLRHMDLTFADQPPESPDVVYFATPARVAMESAAGYLDAGATVIDCSPDFRLQDLDVWQHWYGGRHTAPQLAAQAVYGLVEHNRDQLAGARLIAAPGCYATVVQLLCVPVLRALAGKAAGQVQVIADCVSGTTGAGRASDRPELLLAEAGDNYSAYALQGHRHAAEILQGAARHAGFEPRLRLNPHLLPLARGMFATVHFVAGDDAAVDIGALYEKFYADDCMIDVLPANTSPQVAGVVHGNRAQLGCASGVMTAFGAIDNLGKGAAGQAVQAMNVALGLPEAAGLS